MSDLYEITTIGFIGLGNMGSPMAKNLIGAGYRVQAFDISPDLRSAIVEFGGADTPSLAAAAAGADLVILMLPDSDVVSAVLGDADLLSALDTGAYVVDMGSSEPLRTRELAIQLKERGVNFVDAPVSGGVSGAKDRTLTIMVGGSAQDVERIRTPLEALGRPIHAGPIGAGHAVKALNNLLSATHFWVTSEAIIAGQRFGLDPEVMLSIFNGSTGKSGSTEIKWPKYVIPETYNSGFKLRLMLKDIRIAVELAEKSGFPIELGADVVELWKRAAADLPEEADQTEIARWLEGARSDSPTIDRQGGQ